MPVGFVRLAEMVAGRERQVMTQGGVARKITGRRFEFGDHFTVAVQLVTDQGKIIDEREKIFGKDKG